MGACRSEKPDTSGLKGKRRFESAGRPSPAVGHAGQPVVDVEGGVAGQVAPELEAVDDLEAGLVAGPGVLVAEGVGHRGIVEVGEIPGAELATCGAEAQLEHRPWTRG